MCDFPRADIHELISSDILHQLVKGTFKDHLIAWVGEYLYLTYSKKDADNILDKIDRRYAFVPENFYNTNINIGLQQHLLFQSFSISSKVVDSSNGLEMTRRRS